MSDLQTRTMTAIVAVEPLPPYQEYFNTVVATQSTIISQNPTVILFRVLYPGVLHSLTDTAKQSWPHAESFKPLKSFPNEMIDQKSRRWRAQQMDELSNPSVEFYLKTA